MKQFYSDEHLIEELRRYVHENKMVPRHQDLIDAHGYPNSGTYRRRFGTLNKAIELAGLTPNRIQYSREELIALLKAFHKKYGRIPKAQDFGENGLPYVDSYINHFGSWNKAIETAEFASFDPHTILWTKEEIIKAIQKFHASFGITPSATDLDIASRKMYPPARQLSLKFSSVRLAQLCAHVPPRTPATDVYTLKYLLWRFYRRILKRIVKRTRTTTKGT